MSFNPAGTKEIAISVFGGLCTEQIGQTLPDGVSPDNQEVEYIPGSVYSRRGLERVFPSGFTANSTITYAKSYIDPTGIIRNLYLDSTGALWVENVNASPGLKIQIATVTAGSYAKSITAFGREYIAFNDTLHGSDIPLQYDGVNLDRITQDGPGGPPTVTSFAYPAVAMVGAGGSPPTFTIAAVYPDQDISGFWRVLNIYLTSGFGVIGVGSTVVISGGTPYDGTYIVVQNPGPGLSLVVSCHIASSTPPYIGPGTLTVTGLSGITMMRGSNIVTVSTATAHNLQVGYRAQISGVTAGVVGTNISSIVINNADSPGIATITMVSAHGLVPGLQVSLTGIGAATVGTSITAIARVSEVVTVTTSTAHNLTVGASITIAGVSVTTFNTNTVVGQVIDATHFTYVQMNTTDATSSGGTVALNWPIPDTETPYYFEVISAPSSTIFQVAISYANGTWASGGLVTYAWDGIFFVRTIIDSTHFTYQQYGPDASTSVVGKVTPFGQASPGEHQCQVAFLTRQGAITAPSPPVKFIANGGQYLSITDIPLGPSNVVGRILAFTGAQGAYFFYIPSTPQINGQVVGTSTQVNDNSSTSVVLDFSDNTLFAGLGISIPGNNLANQITLDGALGFGLYASRLLTWGQRNRIQNFLNLGFDGGYYVSSPNIPTGWLSTGTGTLAAGHYGQGWLISTAGAGNFGLLYQPAFEDAYGAPILTGNTKYRIRVWLKLSASAPDLNFNVWLNSPSTGFTAQAVISGSVVTTSGVFLEAAFDLATPADIPADMQLEIFASSTSSIVNLLVDELSIIYAENPYLNTIMFGSYVNNPEGFDGLTGKLGSTQDVNQIMDLGIIRNTLYFLTLDPAGRIHQTSDNGVTEPAGWQVGQVAANCGLLSAFCLTKSQADDSSGSGGEEWWTWISNSGPRIFGGDQPFKIGQELQPNWTGDFKRGFAGINFPAALTCWAINNPTERLILFGIPSLDSPKYPGITAPNMILALSYRQLDTAYQIATSGPIHTSLAGKLIATDHTRKWTRWNLAMNGAALMYREPGGNLQTVLLAGNGSSPSLQGPFIEVNIQPVSYDEDISVNAVFVSNDGVIQVNGV